MNIVIIALGDEDCQQTCSFLGQYSIPAVVVFSVILLILIIFTFCLHCRDLLDQLEMLSVVSLRLIG